MNAPHNGVLVLDLADPGATLDWVGGKGASLARLAAARLPVPDGFHLTTRAYRRFVQENRLAGLIVEAAGEARSDDPSSLDHAAERIRTLFVRGMVPEDVAKAIRTAYDALGHGTVAVRSSATAEDLPELSFAGQQETFLNVQGAANVLEAVKGCWASLWSARALAYRARQGLGPDELALAVVVQRLVPADAAGVMFTADPVSGTRDRIVINAAWGLGEAIVGGLVTPDTFVVDKASGAVRSRTIAEKAVLTVPTGRGTREEPVPAGWRKQPALRATQVAELARLGRRIEALYGQPMDVEWALAKGRLAVLQARPITALPDAPPSLTWDLPRRGGRYARSSVIELLPDPLSPLFASLALPIWSEAMRALMGELGFPIDCSMTLVTINDYAYYDLTALTRQSVRVLFAFPKVVVHAWPRILHARARWAERARPGYARVVEERERCDPATTPTRELIDGVRAIVHAAAEHYLAIQSGILPAAYTSELLLTQAYDRFVRRPGDPPAMTLLLGFDSTPIRAEKSLYDLAQWVRAQPTREEYERWPELQTRLAEHLARFGHTVFDLDFAKPLPADDPPLALESLKHALDGSARDPHARQAALAEAREEATRAVLARLQGWRLRQFTRLLRWAQSLAPAREDALADVGLGWPLVRRLLREVGRRLVAAGVLAEVDDVFWLMRHELNATVRDLETPGNRPDYTSLVARRRARWERERAVTPPSTLPIEGGARFWGFDWSSWMPAQTGQAEGPTIRGQAGSPGRVRGTARVIHGPHEFGQMHRGDILVAKITTPAWTPLFALASGVVTDVGGPLSHSSIVAREYQIPAVLGAGVATARIRDGQEIVVDGDAGVVELLGSAQ
jgi:pyruvate,water dikinase